jgi:hypothetical protein
MPKPMSYVPKPVTDSALHSCTCAWMLNGVWFDGQKTACDRQGLSSWLTARHSIRFCPNVCIWMDMHVHLLLMICHAY